MREHSDRFHKLRDHLCLWHSCPQPPHIAKYKYPQSMEFVTERPFSAAGKILKCKLRDPYLKEQSRAGS
ncbi:hypothetical protein GCM10009104_13100 [Marinobacterium maritimum]|uniref:AMP-binding enzyme C-terminal domain-containing protein n=1 Tax=Marinobacterium maritimum TaxID=500162 RepID=A0ABN1I4T9_9GAMM